MNALLSYGRMAEAHWREHCPRLVHELETRGRLREALLDAQEQTTALMDQLLREFRRQGLSPQQAHDRAWELVRGRHLFLPPEES